MPEAGERRGDSLPFLGELTLAGETEEETQDFWSEGPEAGTAHPEARSLQ